LLPAYDRRRQEVDLLLLAVTEADQRDAEFVAGVGKLAARPPSGPAQQLPSGARVRVNNWMPRSQAENRVATMCATNFAAVFIRVRRNRALAR
jgi:hypothetical protein